MKKRAIYYIIFILFALPACLYSPEAYYHTRAVDKALEQNLSEPVRSLKPVHLLQEDGDGGLAIVSWYDYDLPDYPNYSKDYRTCASRVYPRGTILKITYQGQSTICRVNDYGPEEQINPKRELDLSSKAFSDLAPLSVGLLLVKIDEAGNNFQ